MTSTNPQIITNQTYLDPDIVAAKRAACDYSVQISPAFEIDGVEYAVVLDGHHSLAAALSANAEPRWTTLNVREHDALVYLEEADGGLKLLDYLATSDDWRDALTGQLVF